MSVEGGVAMKTGTVLAITLLTLVAIAHALRPVTAAEVTA